MTTDNGLDCWDDDVTKKEGMVSVCRTTSLGEKDKSEEEDENRSNFFCCRARVRCNSLCLKSLVVGSFSCSLLLLLLLAVYSASSNEKCSKGSFAMLSVLEEAVLEEEELLIRGVMVVKVPSKLARSVSEDR